MFEVPKNLDTILHIGAGQCEELPAYLESSARRIILVEPNPNLADSLRQRTRGENRVQILEVAITDDSKLSQLTEYNLPEAASLYQPTGLRDIFPGLRSIASHTVTVKTPQGLLEELSLAGHNNLLVIQAPGAEKSIVHGLSGHSLMDCFSDLIITANSQPFYKSNSYAEPVLAELKEQGYDAHGHDNQDAEWPQWHLMANPLGKKLKKLGKEKQALLDELQQSRNELDKANALAEKREKELVTSCKKIEEENKQLTERANKLDGKAKRSENHAEELAGRVEELKKRRDTLQKQLGDEQQAHKGTQEDLDKIKVSLTDKNKELEEEQRSRAKTQEELEKLKAVLGDKNKKLEEVEKSFEAKSKELDELKAGKQRFDDLEAKLDALSGSITNHIDKKLLNTSKQIESSMGLQQYLSSGELPLNYHGWPISPDLAIYLAEKIETQNYDLVIEFGSGTSTSLFAKTIINKIWRSQSSMGKQDLLERKGEENYAKNLAFIEPAEEDLPKRVVTFEHSREFYGKTKNSLEREGLERVVDLVHAPLVSYSVKGIDYLYYSCDSTLSKLQKMFEGRTSKILVLVDGPPGVTGPMARLPALPKLLDIMPGHQCDIILDDFNREEEKKIADEWLKIIEERGIRCEVEKLDFEKGAICISIRG